MHQPADNKKDIFIPLLYHRLLNDEYGSVAIKTNFDYNVSKFIRLHDSDESLRKRIANADKIVHLLDAKVYIDTSGPKYARIYQGIDTIVKRIVTGLSRLDPFFAKCKLRQTGSSISGVKVGLPHESDYVLEIPRDRLLKTGKSFDSETLFPLVELIIAEQAFALIEGLEGTWKLHGVEHYNHIGGICIVMQCSSCTENPTKENIGVTVDLVPVYIMETATRTFTAMAGAFLQHSLAEYAEKRELYRVNIDVDKCDTGFIENTIMKKLPEDTKRAFRVAKFFISHFWISPYIPFETIKTLDEESRLNLYGRKPWISSYKLRVFFLLLLIHVHGTEAQQRLKGGLLVLCLLDMCKQYAENWMNKSRGTYYYYQIHPLLRDVNWSYVLIPIPLEPLTIVNRLMDEENQTDAVEQLSLLNNKNPVYDSDFYESDS